MSKDAGLFEPDRPLDSNVDLITFAKHDETVVGAFQALLRFIALSCLLSPASLVAYRT
jgi:hypothetical protein